MESIASLKSKLQKMSAAKKASLALLFASFCTKGLGMISNLIFTRIMPTAEYGMISTFTAWQSILYIVATLNMSSGVFNNGMLDFRKDRSSYMFSTLCLSNTCTIALALIYFIFHRALQNMLLIPDSLMLLMFAGFLLTPARAYWNGRQRYEYKFKLMTFFTIAISLLSMLVSVIAVLSVSDNEKAVAKLVASEGVLCVAAMGFYIYIAITAKFSLKIKYWKYNLSFNLPLVIHYLSMYILSGSDRIMITSIIDTSATAIYNLAYTVAAVVLIFWQAIEASWTPWIYEKLHNNDTGEIPKRANQILLIFAGCSIFATLLAPECMKILGPETYHDGIYVIPSVVAGVYFTAVYSLYMRIELYTKKTQLVTIATTIAAILNVVLNKIMIPIFGFYAAGYTTLFSYMFLAGFHYLNIKHLGYGYIYDNKKIFAMSMIVIAINLLSTLLFPFTVIRYTVIAIIIAICIARGKDILLILKNK